VRVAVVRAAAQLTRAGGPPAATVDAIAKRAAVSRTTIYKWWPSSAAIVLEGLLDSVPDRSLMIVFFRCVSTISSGSR
jgi:AcrR family transcriptional regulator